MEYSRLLTVLEAHQQATRAGQAALGLPLDVKPGHEVLRSLQREHGRWEGAGLEEVGWEDVEEASLGLPAHFSLLSPHSLT
jgi:hypothetical protein